MSTAADATLKTSTDMPEHPHHPDQPPSEHPAEGRGEPGSSGDDDLIAAARLAADARSDGLSPEPDLPAPDYFPGYVVSREIHRGGQGIVYQAVHKGTKRKVAIKVMREGALASIKERTRFEREVEILAQLDHRNIVAVHDSGSVEGRFYYVMDYVSGTTLDVWVSQREPTLPDLLELFAKICDAVNAAHLKGVIHRDLKPANVRVDGAGQPHIVDFGLAKVATGDLSDDDRPMTVTGQFIGSLPWSSPEQAQGIPGMIDVRTDVYSLGVMLYQMLTGRFPYQVVGNMRDVLDNILRSEPARPSTIRRQINDEIETIVLKCLSKERERRYQSAGELSRDILHYLRGEPIEAKRDSGWYILRKAARRYRTPFAAAGAFLVLLLGSTVVVGALYAQRERALVELAAEAQAKQEVIDTLERWFTAPDPNLGLGPNVTVRELLDAAAADLASGPDVHPRVEAAVRRIMGRTYLSFGMDAAAAAHLRRAMELAGQIEGPDGEMKLFAQSTLALALRSQDQLDEAAALLGDLLERTRRTLGPGHQRTLTTLNDLAQVHKRRRDPGAAEPLLREAVAGAEADASFDRAALAKYRANLGELLVQTGRAEEALPFLSGAVEALAAASGPGHPDTGRARVRLAGVLDALGETAEAEGQLRLACDSLSALGEGHPEHLATRVRLASAQRKLGRTDEAVELLRSIAAAGEAAEAPESPRLAWYRQSLGAALVDAGRTDEARPLLESAVAVLQAANHPFAVEGKRALLRCCEAQGDEARAAELRAQLGDG